MKKVFTVILSILFIASPLWGFSDNPYTNEEKTIVGNTSGINTGDQPGFYNCVIPQPGNQYDNSVYIPLDPKTAGAETITAIEISCDSASYELDWDLMYADALIGMANATIAQAVDTTNGVLSLSAQSISIPSGKAVYLRLNADPSDSIKWVSFKATY